MKIQLALFAITSSVLQLVSTNKCNIKIINDDNSVCVCDSFYCDKLPSLEKSSAENFQLYSTSKRNLGFTSNVKSFSNNLGESGIITINPTTKYQTIIGFGGAFTDSTGINIASLPEKVQDLLLESYFGDDGIEYSLCRVPIGGTDFSIRGYTYDDYDNDKTLSLFQLQDEDLNYKIPFIHKAKTLRDKKSFNLFASVWTAPRWMKSRYTWARGVLRDEYYQLWANYFIKFLDAYLDHKINFWGITTQNEPLDGINDTPINSMAWLPHAMNKWIINNLGPTIRNSSYRDIKIILFDGNRVVLPWLSLLIDNNETLSYSDGVAVHWYTDFMIPPFFLNLAKTPKKDLFLLYTEACNGYFAPLGIEKPVDLGSWERGEKYIDDIITNLENGIAGWVDWNMALDPEGGPTYIKNFVDSPIIVNATAGEFYKQPMFYALGHFSKFVIPNSVRVDVSFQNLNTLKAVAFQRPDNLIAVIIYNSLSEDVDVQVKDSDTRIAKVTLEANSINTLLYTK